MYGFPRSSPPMRVRDTFPASTSLIRVLSQPAATDRPLYLWQVNADGTATPLTYDSFHCQRMDTGVRYIPAAMQGHALFDDTTATAIAVGGGRYVYNWSGALDLGEEVSVARLAVSVGGDASANGIRLSRDGTTWYTLIIGFGMGVTNSQLIWDNHVRYIQLGSTKGTTSLTRTSYFYELYLYPPADARRDAVSSLTLTAAVNLPMIVEYTPMSGFVTL